jgi:hypothetical protein
MYVDAYRKVAPDTHWDCFEVTYGNPVPGVLVGAAFVVVNTMKSRAETDKGIAPRSIYGRSHSRRAAVQNLDQDLPLRYVSVLTEAVERQEWFLHLCTRLFSGFRAGRAADGFRRIRRFSWWSRRC